MEEGLAGLTGATSVTFNPAVYVRVRNASYIVLGLKHIICDATDADQTRRIVVAESHGITYSSNCCQFTELKGLVEHEGDWHRFRRAIKH
jgi:hypothetical protein